MNSPSTKVNKINGFFIICAFSCAFNIAYAVNANDQKTSIASIEKRLTKAQSFEEDGKLQLALIVTKKLFEEDSEHIEVSISYASQLIKTNQADKAQKIIQPLIDNSRDDWRVWFWLGTAQLMKKDLENASDSLSTALALNGEEIAIWVQKSIVEQEKGNSKAALNFLQVANALQPNNPDVLINYAYANESESDLNKAVQLYRYFLRLSASDKSKGALRSEIMLRLVQISSAQSLVDEKVINEL